MKQNKTRKIDWWLIIMYAVVVLLASMLIFRIWHHDIEGSVNNSIWIVCTMIWIRVYKIAEHYKKENEGLKIITVGLLSKLEDKSDDEKKPSTNIPVPVWRICKAGYKFDSDAIVVGLGEDKDPRLVRCAVNDSKYILVKDLIDHLETKETANAAK